MKVYLITITKIDGGFVNFQMVDSEEKAFEYVRAFNSKHTKYIAKYEEM
jgi:gamma-glutamyl phosphate reductase